MRAARSERYEAVIGEFRDALEYDRADLHARLGLARALFSAGRFSEARNHLIDLRVAEPTHAVVNRLLGDIAQGEGRWAGGRPRRGGLGGLASCHSSRAGSRGGAWVW